MKNTTKQTSVWQHFQKSLSTIHDVSNKSFLLAVSGGLDSMVLVHLFKKAALTITVAHVNFQLRGEESDKDAELVHDFCVTHSIPFRLLNADTQSYCKKNKVGVQEGARNIRYDWFNELISKETIDYIVTAHHLDDSIETFLINAMRGSGIRGLRGIELIDDTRHLFRPLVSSTKKDLETFANNEAVKFRLDKSNLKNEYLRNAIRNKVIPKLVDLDAQFSEKMGLTLSNLQLDADFLNAQLTEQTKRILQKKDTYFEIREYQSIHPRLLLHCLEQFNFPSSVLSEVLKTTHSGKQFIGKTHTLLVDRTNLIISDNEAILPHLICETINKLGKFDLEGFGSFTLQLVNEFEPNFTDPNEIYVDFDQLTFPLIIRNWQSGDSFVPFGMKGKKKVSDLLTDLKLSKREKENVLLLLSGQNIIWVIGIRMAEKYKIDKKTKNILKIVTR